MNIIDRITFWLYAAVLGLLFGGIASAQILSLLNVYTPLAAVLGTIVSGALLVFVYVRLQTFSRQSSSFFAAVFHSDDKPRTPLELAAFLGGLIFLVLLVFPPLAWPFTPITETLPWDAGSYHFPKAIELYRTGSAWDLTLSYGEYPFGYESLLSLGLSIKGNALLFGPAHALIAVFLSLTTWLLARRYSRLSPGLLFFAVNALLVSGALPFESNPWWILRHLVYTIGKNDLFLGAALLAVVLHAPVGTIRNRDVWHPIGLAAASMIAISIKPNALLLVGLIWVWVLWRWFKERPAGRNPLLAGKGFIPWKSFLFLALLFLPGFLWMIRNFAAQGALFSGEVSNLFGWSIAANLANPFLYRHIPQHLILLAALVALSLALSITIRRPSFTISAVFLVLFAGFIFTPASAFLSDTGVPAQIAWRFSAAVLVYMFLVLLNLFDPFLMRLAAWINSQRFLPWSAAAVLVLAAAWLGWDQRRLLSINPKNAIVLEDQFREPVGVDGYHSAYDFVQQNIRNAVITVDNGLPFYLYDPGFTNTTSQQRPAAFFVVFRTAWYPGGSESYPDRLETEDFQQTWTLIYEDTQGRVYQRR